jgi:hypothetical protein
MKEEKCTCGCWEQKNIVTKEQITKNSFNSFGVEDYKEHGVIKYLDQISKNILYTEENLNQLNTKLQPILIKNLSDFKKEVLENEATKSPEIIMSNMSRDLKYLRDKLNFINDIIVYIKNNVDF